MQAISNLQILPDLAMNIQSLHPRQIYRSLVRRFMINGPDPYGRISFSQEGEDLILSRFLEPRKKGWYVDIGAHHPKRFSNTYYFYLRGWSGLNIDAMSGSMAEFNRLRPRDINLEMAVAEEESTRLYYVFNETALNTFNEKLAAEREKLDQYHIVETIPVNCRRLEHILQEYMPENRHIDFMSIDAEGSDLEILRSNDWERFRPDFLVAECLDFNQAELRENRIMRYLGEKGYVMVAKCFNSVIFRSEVALSNQSVLTGKGTDPKGILL